MKREDFSTDHLPDLNLSNDFMPEVSSTLDLPSRTPPSSASSRLAPVVSTIPARDFADLHGIDSPP